MEPASSIKARILNKGLSKAKKIYIETGLEKPSDNLTISAKCQDSIPEDECSRIMAGRVQVFWGRGTESKVLNGPVR
jgi:hypothetical protein